MKTIKEALKNLPEFVYKDINYETFEKELNGKEIKTAKLPRLYQVETTTRCNLRCEFCPRTQDLVKNKRRDTNAVMSLDKFIELLNRMPWVKSIELFHFGEPFMQNDIHEYIRACKERGVYVVMASNLLVATDDKIDKALNAGLDYLVIDLDSLDKMHYEKCRPGGNLDILKGRIKYLLAHPKRPYCVIQSIKIKGKKEYTKEEFKKWTGGLMPDEFRYRFYEGFRGFIADKGKIDENVICKEPFYGFCVHVNGNVTVCARDWAGENVMGNVFKQSINEIWNSKKYKDFRKAMKSKNKPAFCKNCKEGSTLFNARSQPHIQLNMFKGLEQ